MSYCRWSTDDFGCDLYCYEGIDGFTTHVAGNRVVGEVPKTPPWPSRHLEDDSPEVKAWAEAMAAASKAQHEWLRTCEHEPITLPHAGETFVDADLEEFRNRLVYLKGLGYRFPDDVLKDVDEEIAEEKANEADEPKRD